MDKFINPSKPAEIEIEKVEEEPLVVSGIMVMTLVTIPNENRS